MERSRITIPPLQTDGVLRAMGRRSRLPTPQSFLPSSHCWSRSVVRATRPACYRRTAWAPRNSRATPSSPARSRMDRCWRLTSRAASFPPARLGRRAPRAAWLYGLAGQEGRLEIRPGPTGAQGPAGPPGPTDNLTYVSADIPAGTQYSPATSGEAKCPAGQHAVSGGFDAPSSGEEQSSERWLRGRARPDRPPMVGRNHHDVRDDRVRDLLVQRHRLPGGRDPMIAAAGFRSSASARHQRSADHSPRPSLFVAAAAGTCVAGLSAFSGGYYPRSWGVAGLACLAVALGSAAVVAAGRASRARRARCSFALTGFTVWVGVSALRPEAATLAVPELERAAFYLVVVWAGLAASRHAADAAEALVGGVLCGDRGRLLQRTRALPLPGSHGARPLRGAASLPARRLCQRDGHPRGDRAPARAGGSLSRRLLRLPSAGRGSLRSACDDSLVHAERWRCRRARGGWGRHGCALPAPAQARCDRRSGVPIAACLSCGSARARRSATRRRARAPLSGAATPWRPRSCSSRSPRPRSPSCS